MRAGERTHGGFGDVRPTRKSCAGPTDHLNPPKAARRSKASSAFRRHSSEAHQAPAALFRAAMASLLRPPFPPTHAHIARTTHPAVFVGGDQRHRKSPFLLASRSSLARAAQSEKVLFIIHWRRKRFLGRVVRFSSPDERLLPLGFAPALGRLPLGHVNGFGEGFHAVGANAGVNEAPTTHKGGADRRFRLWVHSIKAPTRRRSELTAPCRYRSAATLTASSPAKTSRARLQAAALASYSPCVELTGTGAP